MFFSSLLRTAALGLLFTNVAASATGIVPETSVIIVEQSDGEGAINLKNTDSFPVLLLSTLQNTKDDQDSLLTITPPAARVEPGKVQSVRFLITDDTPLKTERLKRVVFEGVPPQKKNQNEVRMTIRQNLPVIIRPAGLAREQAPWKLLSWTKAGNDLTVTNPSPYVVRLSQKVSTLPGKGEWMLPEAYLLPGQTVTLTKGKSDTGIAISQVTLYPATTWGFSVASYTATVAG
ncbi:fimbria/pilus chaperone family protein [Erwinia piriflorinigrans]|uniref:Chaperone protein focC n=1 Tax=Erwinia piriflorinigrans CFBP 5888 TaxID=1161919 RepID=V5ZBZ3_9GAMM|nr:fimbria/pilus chaperone family protein [Erwinia piriflorinigrans]CCG88532.1 Chaperone protein focC [Erwinia piriflorinigrans CFBP 5888]